MPIYPEILIKVFITFSENVVTAISILAHWKTFKMDIPFQCVIL